MCVIIYCKKDGNRPTEKVLKKCEQANPHGIGVAYQRKGSDMYTVAKGISFNTLIKIMNRHDGEIGIHFRYATVGGKTKELCHPFPTTPKVETWLDYESNAILFSNGTWENWDESYEMHRQLLKLKKLDGQMSDTRALAKLVSKHGKTGFLNYVKDVHAKHDFVRCLIMKTSKPAAMTGTWHKVGGVMYSNTRWQVNTRRSVANYWGRARVSDILGQATLMDENDGSVY